MKPVPRACSPSSASTCDAALDTLVHVTLYQQLNPEVSNLWISGTN